MTIVGRGLGRDSDVLGSYVAFGLGRKVVAIGIVEGEITFSIDLDYDTVNNIYSNQEISFDTVLDYGTINNLIAVAGIDLEFDAATQVTKQLITNKDALLGLDLSLDATNFLLTTGLVPTNLYIIPEEKRSLPVYIEVRECAVGEEARIELIKFEDRLVIVIPKYEV